MKGIFPFVKNKGVDAYDLVPAERQNKTTALSVALVLASNGFVHTNPHVRDFSPAGSVGAFEYKMHSKVSTGDPQP